MVKVARPYSFGFLALGFACAGGLQTARAQELADPRDKADRLCASYGRGFVAGHAPGHCVTVQERLRVEPDRHRVMSNQDPAPMFSATQDAPLRNRLRLNGGFGTAAIR